MPPISTWYGLLIMITLRYFIISGLAFVIWYKLLRKKAFFKKIQPRFPAVSDYQLEIIYSVLSIIIFTAVTSLILQTGF